MIRRIATIITTAGLAALVFVPAASASPIRECGHLPVLFRGYEEVSNVTSRNVGCSHARELAYYFTKTVIRRNYDGWPRRNHVFHVGY